MTVRRKELPDGDSLVQISIFSLAKNTNLAGSIASVLDHTNIIDN